MFEFILIVCISVAALFFSGRTFCRSFWEKGTATGCSGACASSQYCQKKLAAIQSRNLLVKTPSVDRPDHNGSKGKEPSSSTCLAIIGLVTAVSLMTVPLVLAEEDDTLTPTGSLAAVNQLNSIQISGFGDIIASRTEDDASQPFDIGQAEVDLETSLGERVRAALAIAYDGGSFSLGAFTVDFLLFEHNENRQPAAAGLQLISLSAGLFDVPFGIDWHVYPSIDRKLVSTPTVIANTHDCWNDCGVFLNMEGNRWNLVGFGANGFEFEGLDPSLADNRSESAYSAGGRIGLRPFGVIEVGGSFAQVANQAEAADMSLAGVDGRFKYRNFALKGEYIRHDIQTGALVNVINSGYYVEGLYDFGKFYAAARYGEFFFEDDAENDITRLSAGAGWILNDLTEIRFEYQHLTPESSNIGLMQLALSF